MITKEELNKYKARDIQKIATKLGVKHSRTYKKDNLVGIIVDVALAESELVNKVIKEIIQDTTSKVQIDLEGKMKRIERVGIGVIVAFKTEDGKCKSAQIINKSVKSRKLKLETAYGKQYVISYDDVIWVRTGARWPKGVYELLKGIKNGETKDKDKEIRA